MPFDYLNTKPGPPSLKHRTLTVPPSGSDFADCFEPAYLTGERYGWDCLLALNATTSFTAVEGASPSTQSHFIVTPQGNPTGDAFGATASGIAMVTGATGDDDLTLQSIRGYTPTTGKRVIGHARFRVDDADNLAVYLGIGATSTVPLTTPPTDFIALRSTTTTSGLLVGSARGDSGTAADSATLATLTDGTFVEVKFMAYVHATNPAGFFVVNGTKTDFSTAQLAQVVAMLTTPQTVYAQLSARTGEAASHTLTMDYAYVWGER